MSLQNKKSVFFICSGLGNVNRGYESFTRECFDVLKKCTSFNTVLLKGGGTTRDNEIVIANIPRANRLAVILSKISGLSGYTIEQLTFFLALMPRLLLYKPRLIFYSDFLLGTYLWHLRRLTGLKYKLLFSNGAPNGPPFTRMDHVQMLLPLYLRKAQEAGVSSSMMSLLPYGIDITPNRHPISIKEKNALRKKIQIPTDKKVILSVGAIDVSHKRMDYVIREFMSLHDFESYYLVLLGAKTVESSLVYELVNDNKLNNVLIREVSSIDVGLYFAAADYFILASLNEGLPRVLPEALSYGLLPIVHDYDVTRETLLEYGIFVDMQVHGSLQEAIQMVDSSFIEGKDCIRFAYENYSWDILANRYISMLNSLLQ